MADVHSKKVRSYNMSRIRSKNTKPEILVRQFLHANGLRFRIHDKKLPGKPDIVLRKYRTVVFINGCFWHGHQSCNKFQIPKTRTKYWSNKIYGNIEKDFLALKSLNDQDWTVITIWTCELKAEKKERTLHQLVSQIKFGIHYLI